MRVRPEPVIKDFCTMTAISAAKHKKDTAEKISPV